MQSRRLRYFHLAVPRVRHRFAKSEWLLPAPRAIRTHRTNGGRRTQDQCVPVPHRPPFAEAERCSSKQQSVRGGQWFCVFECEGNACDGKRSLASLYAQKFKSAGGIDITLTNLGTVSKAWVDRWALRRTFSDHRRTAAIYVQFAGANYHYFRLAHGTLQFSSGFHSLSLSITLF